MNTSPPLRILVVDDTQTHIDAARVQFEDLNVELVTTTNYKEAFELLEENDFDMVLTDLMMPFNEADEDRFSNPVEGMSYTEPWDFMESSTTQHPVGEVIKNTAVSIGVPYIGILTSAGRGTGHSRASFFAQFGHPLMQDFHERYNHTPDGSAYPLSPNSKGFVGSGGDYIGWAHEDDFSTVYPADHVMELREDIGWTNAEKRRLEMDVLRGEESQRDALRATARAYAEKDPAKDFVEVKNWRALAEHMLGHKIAPKPAPGAAADTSLG